MSNQKNTNYNSDPQTLRAKGGNPRHENPSMRPTDPVGLSRSILHVLKEYNYVQIDSVGPQALNSVMSAFRLAAREVEGRTHSSVLALRQAEYTAIIDGKPTKGLRTRIFAIPIEVVQ